MSFRSKQILHATCGGTVHRIDDHLQVHCPESADQARDVQLATQTVQVVSPTIEASHRTLDRGCDSSCRQSAFHGRCEVAFHGTAERSLDFQSQPFRRVVAGGDHQSTKGLPLHNRPAAGWCGDSCFGEQRF